MTKYFSLNAMKHIAARQQQCLIGGSRPGNSITIAKDGKLTAQSAKRLSK